MAEASNWKPDTGFNAAEQFRQLSSGRGRQADAVNMDDSDLIVEVDPKQRFDPRRSASAPPGYYPDGIDSAQGFDLSDDNVGDNAGNTGMRTASSALPPKLGSRLSDLDVGDHRRGGTRQ